MEFDGDRNLIIADAKKVLLSVSPEGKLTVLATEIEGNKFSLTDDIDVAKDGKIYFTDPSEKYGIAEYAIDLISHTPNGRLLVYAPETKETKVLLKDILVLQSAQI